MEGATLVDYSGHTEGVYCDCYWNGGSEGVHLFVFHLPKRIADGDLKTLFSLFGRIVSTKVGNAANRFLWTSEADSARALGLSAMTLPLPPKILFTG